MEVGKYTLKEVVTAYDERQFLDLPKRLYKGNRNWVCPLDNDIKAVFDKSRNELFAEGEAIRWIAIDSEGKVVGRIAAFYDKQHAFSYEQPTGGCGFFEAINDQELANTLFDAAREWLAQRGMEAMDGPINFGSRDSWWGVLVEGFEFQPLYGNPYNPPYYKELFEGYGFHNYFNQNSYIWRVDEDNLSEIALEKAHRVLSNKSYHIERIDMHNLEDEAENFRQIYNKAWSLFTGVKPMESDEAQAMLQKIKPIIDPNLIYFAYHEQEPIGFFIMVPDLNSIIGKFNGKFGIVNQLRLLWNLKVTRSCERVFGLIFGITPDYHGKGIESAIMTHILETYIRSGHNRYKSFEFAWIGDFNPVMNRMIERYVCAKRHKMHTTYRYLFDRSKPFTRCPRLGLKRREE
ncbi:MAG: hypothetical protein J6Q20_03005 [Alistipes sp.]|nr:hypothetical protein [Alistipes sp.]